MRGDRPRSPRAFEYIDLNAMTVTTSSKPIEGGNSPAMDLRGTPCPLNFVRAKLRLQQMSPGQLLELWLDPGEPVEQVPNSLTMAGYTIESLQDNGEFFSLKVWNRA